MMGFEETIGGKVGVQFFPVFGGKFLLPGFPADGSVFLVNLLVGSVVGDMGKDRNRILFMYQCQF